MGQILDNGPALPYFPKTAASKVTFEEYLACDSESGYVEGVDGEIVFLPNPTFQHQETLGFLLILLLGFNSNYERGTIVQTPFAMKLPTLNRSRVPDILFVTKEREHLFAENYLNGAADVAIEIISPGTGRTDRGDKYFEYEVSGVNEYWLIDPERQHAEFYQLGDDKLYHTMSLQEETIFRSAIITGFGFGLIGFGTNRMNWKRCASWA